MERLCDMKHHDCAWTSETDGQTSCLRSRLQIAEAQSPFLFDTSSVFWFRLRGRPARLKTRRAPLLAMQATPPEASCRSALHYSLHLPFAAGCTSPLTSHWQLVLTCGSFGGMEGDMRMLGALARLTLRPASPHHPSSHSCSRLWSRRLLSGVSVAQSPANHRLLWPWDRPSSSPLIPPLICPVRTSYPPWPLNESSEPAPLILLPLAPQLISDLLVACDYHCCDVLDRVPPVAGADAEDLRSAIWTYRSGVNSRHEKPENHPSWWKQFEAELDAASVMYWRPFALPPAKANASEGPASASSSTAVLETKEACVGSRQIKSFFSKVSCEEAAAATATSLSESRLVERKPAPAAASKDNALSITSYFANISEREAEEATAAALAAAAVPSAFKRERAESSVCAASGIAKFFMAGGGSCGAEGSGGEVIVIEE